MSNIHTLYLVHHSHTDVGYTSDQPIVWDLHTRFLDEAIDLAEKYANHQSDGAFRWTVETTEVLRRWLERASPTDVERLVALERAGRIEVMGMFANITPLFDADQLVESLQAIGWLRRAYGFTIRHAMNCDVNGENWPLVDLLLDAGVEGFTMAINTHFGGALTPRPSAFWWQGPSGRRILTYCGWSYDRGWSMGIGNDAEKLEQVWLPRVQRHLDETGYPLPILMVQSFDPFGDNGSAFDFTPFIDAWNAEGKMPRIVFATPAMWWDAVRQHQDLLPVWRGDWTDFWNFGSVSSMREQAINRRSRARLRNADALHAAVAALPTPEAPAQSGAREWASQSYGRYRAEAWTALHLWDEHTWGADISLRIAESEDTLSQWNHKGHYAYTARSLSLLLQRDGVADLARRVGLQDKDVFLLFNPLPWEQELAGVVQPAVQARRGRADDSTASRHHLDRNYAPSLAADVIAQRPADQPVWFLRPTRVAGFGYTVVHADALKAEKPILAVSEEATVENHRFRIVFDRERGGVISLFDKALDWEWVDGAAGDPLHGFVHEQVADEKHAWPRHLLNLHDWRMPTAEIPRGWKQDWWARRSRPSRVINHKVYRTPLGVTVVQTLEAPGMTGPLTQRVFLPDHADFVDCESSWVMGAATHPEAHYLLFPFHLPDAVARLDLGGQAMIPEQDQLPGACRDYFTVQQWVDFSNGERGVTVALPDNPMIQLGGFHFGRNQMEFRMERPMLLGWAANNYWETNFRAHQPGLAYGRYRLHPHAGGFDEAQAHRWGAEAGQPELVMQPLGEARLGGDPLPNTGDLLQLPEPPVLVTHIRPDGAGGLLVRLLNASDEARTAHIASGLLTIRAAGLCDLLDAPQKPLPVVDGAVLVDAPPRRFVVVQIDIS
jgi:hypothetical protein